MDRRFARLVAELVCLRFIEQGFVVAIVEYRLARDAPAPAAVEDVIEAANWFAAHARQYGADPKRIVVTGDSAGGHLALMVGLAPRTPVRAVVNFFWIADVNDQLQGPNQRAYTVQWAPPQPGRAELAHRVPPLSHIHKNAPPILTIHGTADPSVPYAHAVRLTDALIAARASARLVTVDQGSHGFPKAVTDEIYDRFAWPFLSRTKVLKQRAAPAAGRTNLLMCMPARNCRF